MLNFVFFDVQYGIVMDAGSSHTQVTLYRWEGDKNRCTGVVRQVATCKIESGIARTPDSAAVGDTLLPCVSRVREEIGDSDALLDTPIYLGATAGMRLLNKVRR